MGKRGPAKLPTALKIQRGTYRAHRDNPNQPERDGPPRLPPWYGKKDRICKRATQVWDELAPKAEADGTLCRHWSEAFANMCMQQAKYEEFNIFALRRVREVETLERYERLGNNALDKATRLQGKFGLTASDNVGVKVKKPTTGDQGDRFLGNKKSS